MHSEGIISLMFTIVHPNTTL